MSDSDGAVRRAPDTPDHVDARAHARCVVCGRDNVSGLQLTFTRREDGGVEASFFCGTAFEGYADQLHGGVIALLLDGAMTNCLFAHGHEAVTAELTVRYHQPVETNRDAVLRAWIDRCDRRVSIVTAELAQDGVVKAAARAKFMGRRKGV